MKAATYFHIIFIMISLTLSKVCAQAPVITGIDKTSATVNEIITITGSGFGNDSSQVRIFFGAALADSVVKISNTEIQVAVPAGATSSSISVTNLNTKLTAYSRQIFTLSYDGDDFNVTKIGLNYAFLEGEYKFPTSGNNLYNLCFCDFDLDGLNDIATSDTESSKVMVLRNSTSDINSAPSFIGKEFNIARTRWVRCGDLNGDGLPDLMFSASNSNNNKEKIYIYKNTSTLGNISFEILSIPISYSVDGNLAARMDIKDIDGDGLPEIAVVDISNAGGVSVFRNISTPGGAISFVTTPVTPFTTFGIPVLELSSIDLEDLNGDGLPELLAGKDERNGIYVFTNNSTSGNISFAGFTMPEAPGRTTNMKVADVDGDKKLDVVIVNDEYVGVLNNITGEDGIIAFAAVKRFDQISLLREGLDIADMDGNGKQDIIIASTTNRVVVLLNKSTPGSLDFNTKKTLVISENTISVRAGDLNGDGKPDLAYTALDSDQISVLLNRNCIKPVLEPQAGLGVCDLLPYRLTATQAIGVIYAWETSVDGVNFIPVADAMDSTFSYTTSTEAFYRVKMSSNHNGFACTNVVSNVVKVIRPEGFVPGRPVIIDPDPQTPFCFGSTVTLEAQQVNAKFVWTAPNGQVIPNASGNQLILNNVTAADAGEYTVYVKASAAQGGCQSDVATTTIMVSEPEAIAIQSENGPVFFEGGQTTLKVAAIANSTYTWKRNGQYITGATAAELLVIQEGDYVAVISNALGCMRESAPYTVAYARTLIPDQSCLNESISFKITPASLMGQRISYRWNFGDNSTSPGDSVNHTFQTTGAYEVSVEILTSTGSVIGSYKENITVLDLPVLTIETSTGMNNLCPGDRLELTANEGFVSYQWSQGETTNKITVSEPGIYTLTVATSSGCTATKSIEVKSVDNPEVTITAPTDRIALGEELLLEANSTADNVVYEWTPTQGLSNTTIANPVARPLVTTMYTCVVTRPEGCQSTAEFTVTVDRSLDVKAQKAFTPNNDGSHDTWHIDRMELYPDCRLTIFNRQGIKLFDAENYSNDNPWDGTLNGKPAPAGVYFYLIKCGGEAGSQTGSVTIIR